jgi:hypothetical protein
MNPEDEPLRIRPIETLTISDFKVNPNVNQGIAYAFKDVVRGREQRRCLQGCVKPECCGNELRSLALMMRDNPRRDQDVVDQKLLEEFMGDNAYKIRFMTPREREEAIRGDKARLGIGVPTSRVPKNNKSSAGWNSRGNKKLFGQGMKKRCGQAAHIFSETSTNSVHFARVFWA